jgi:hypothetical protein
MDRIRKAVKFQHRIATGHSTLDKPFVVETENPLYNPNDASSSATVKQQFRQHKPVPTALVVDDALILASYPTKEGEQPKVTLLYNNGGSMNGADWHNAVSVENDVPHRDHDGAEEGERFWFDPYEEAKRFSQSQRKEIASLRAQLAATTEGKDEALQKLADSMARNALPGGSPSSVVTETKHYSDGSSATGPAPLPDLSPDQQAAQQASGTSADKVIAALEAAASDDPSPAPASE